MARLKASELERRAIENRLTRLTDAYLDQLLEKDAFEERRAMLLMEKKTLEERIGRLQGSANGVADNVAQFLERAKSVYRQYISSQPEEKRDLVPKLTSNRSVSGKNIYISLRSPFLEMANRTKMQYDDPYRDRLRTLDERCSAASAINCASKCKSYIVHLFKVLVGYSTRSGGDESGVFNDLHRPLSP